MKDIFEKYNSVNLKHINNYTQVTEKEKEILKDNNWKFIINENHSSIENIFIFNSNYEAIEFINLVKEKCDEIDHHPFWVLEKLSNNKTSLNVNLTSHFNNNNITDKDIFIGAFMTYNYNYLKK